MRGPGVVGAHGAWADEAHHRLADAGYRVGGAREAVIGLLAREGGCLTAQDIADSLRGTAAPASVYRALSAMVDLQLLWRRDMGSSGAALYELRLTSGEHHHHVVCDGCGATETFADPQLEAALERVQRQARYRVRDHDVVLHGLCPDCAEPR